MSVYRCAVRTSAGASNFINVFHVEATGTTPADVAAYFGSTCTAAMVAVLSDQARLEDITVTDLSTMQQAVGNINSQGTVFGDMCPPQCAAVITWRTAQVGRKYRGRNYIPALSEASQQSGTISAGHVILLGTLAIALRSTWPIACGGQLVVYHKATSTTTPITNFTIRPTVYTQRRRTLGQGS